MLSEDLQEQTDILIILNILLRISKIVQGGTMLDEDLQEQADILGREIIRLCNKFQIRMKKYKDKSEAIEIDILVLYALSISLGSVIMSIPQSKREDSLKIVAETIRQIPGWDTDNP